MTPPFGRDESMSRSSFFIRLDGPQADDSSGLDDTSV
jgi:hypothetical protein